MKIYEQLGSSEYLLTNIKKIKVVNKNIMLKGQPVEYIGNFCYFGIMMTISGAGADINNRLNKARGAFEGLQSV